MYAMVEIKGKQYRANEGAVLKVDRMDGESGDVLEFDSVLMLRNDEDIKVGNPYVDGASVKAVLEDHGRDRKITVLKFKRRKNYSRKYGHRQSYSAIRIKEIVG
jgi:large subunit ribosomal protein L21